MTSLIYNTFNRIEQLTHGLNSILSKETLPDEIIIVDDGSTDNTRDVIEKFQLDNPKIQWQYIYIPYKEEKTSSNISCRGKNIGIKAAKGDILIFSDPEIIHVEDTIKILLEELEKDSLSVPIATQIWTMGERIYKKLNIYNFEKPITIINHEFAFLTDAEHPDNRKAPDADFSITGSNNCFAGCFFICKKEDMLALHGFDEELTGHGWEDWDMFHRLAKYGRPFKLINTCPIVHLWHPRNYSVNIYEAAERNGKISEANIKANRLIANPNDWGII